MKVSFVLIFLLFFSTVTFGQVRNGWRSVYDKEGRLARMNYYRNGRTVLDSNLFIQYYTGNIPKGLVRGEIAPNAGCVNGNISLFDYSGMLTSYNIKKGGELVYDVDCDYYGNCKSMWRELFDSNSGFWQCDSFTVNNSELVIHNTKSLGVAVYEPEIPINLNNSFACKLVIPVQGNNAKQGIAIGWKNSDNYYLFELMFGKYYTVQYWEDGVYKSVTDGRQAIERLDEDQNEIVLKKNDQNLIFELNGVIEMVLPVPNLKGEKVALVTRSRGNARFSDFIMKYQLTKTDYFFQQHWVGKGSGFFISKTGKILTTYENIMDANSIRIRGRINKKEYVLPAKIIRVDDVNNLAVLQIDDKSFQPFDTLPFGYSNRPPVSDSKVFCIGYPNALSGIYMEPEVFEGKVMPGRATTSDNRLLELDFRNGMIGAPVFDSDFLFLGIYSSKGLELNYSEMIDFYNNSRLFIANIGKTERRIVSPYKGRSYEEKYRAGSELVVIIESSVFSLDPPSDDEFWDE
ncbi:MAG: serine protease [Prolixibacteraceae bacterium]|jgi:hypothetical protein|nr:serine protease [Prolixibacteraceae bacterium]